MDHRIVAATPSDYSLIEQIAHATWPTTFVGILTSLQIEYMLERMYRPEAIAKQVGEGHVFHLLLVPDQVSTSEYSGQSATRYCPVGYVSHQLDYLPGTTKVHKIYLLPAIQGRGYGRLLLNYIAGIARRAGQDRLRLDVNYQNKAVTFYEHLGFTKLDRFNTDIGNGFLMEDWRMEKGL